MNKNYRSIIAVLLSFIMILSLGMSVVTVRAENTTGSSQTIDGTDREHGISQIQTVVPDYIFASAIYDGLKSRNHLGDGIQSVKEVLATYTGNIYADGYLILTVYEVTAKKVDTVSGNVVENIEKDFDSREEAEAYMATLVDTAEFSYIDKVSYSYQKNTMIPREDDELIHDITGIEWLRKADTIYLRQNKISDLSPLDINHISALAEEMGETDSTIRNGEKWFGSEGQNLYIDFRENPIRKYPSTTVGRLEWPRLESASFEIEVEPYILIKEDQADKRYNAEIEIPLIERDGERIDIRDNGCRIVQNNISGSEITSWTKERVNLSGLAHSGSVKIGIEGADNSQISSWMVDGFDLNTIGSSTLKFVFEQSVRIYSPASVAPSRTKTIINLEKVAEDTEELTYLEGAAFRLYKADIIDGNYVPNELYGATYYTTDENGKITIEEELPSGDYCLIEEKAPEHYIMKATPFGFSVGGSVTLTGGTPELTPTEGNMAEAAENVTYIDRYSPNVSLTVTPAVGNTVEKIVITYFDRQEQDYKEISFNENDGNAAEAAENWINSNKGDNDNPGLIDGSVSLQVDFQHTPLNFRATNKGTGGITVSKKVLGNAADKTQRFSFTVTLDDNTINGTYGEMNFVNGVAVFELADSESISANDLPEGINYEVVESDSDDYTVTSENAEGIIKTGEMISVVFNNHKEDSDTTDESTETVSGETDPSEKPTDTDEPDTKEESGVTDEPESSNQQENPSASTKPTDSDNPDGSREPSASEGQQTLVNTNNVPDTSDKTDVIMWFTLFIVSALGLAAMPFLAKKQQ